MERLAHATRGGSPIDNKPYVYFSAHPKDFALYFGVLSGEIWQHSNCVIWYAPSARSVEDPEHRFDLEQMQLLIFPVTERFLTEDSEAIREYRYAIGQHIPVLPIAVESGLEERFAQVCRDIQFLDRTERDVTALGYDEKLARFLNAVLISDETAKKIRSAFDATIFLSYRKMDRRYAQELMRLIHRSDQCRDIALWYDEFLTIGENYKNEIAENIQESDAVALAITPNVLAEGNYVLEVEYPCAKRLHKMVLPFEMQATDRETLYRKFGLTDCVKAKEQSVARYMAQVYHALEIRPKPRDSVHNFFIGLAYLKGLDVERNCERAAVLITGAAKEGLPEAMEKLVTMYREAEGVERDYDKALQWQILYVDRLKEMAARDPGAVSNAKVYSAVAELVVFYGEQNRLEEAYELCGELMELGQKILDESGETACMIYALSLRTTMAWQLETIGRRVGIARAALEDCIAYCEKEYRKSGSEHALHVLALCYYQLGQNAELAGQLTAAHKCFEKGVAYCRHIVERSADESYRNMLAMLLAELGDAEQHLKQYSFAKGHLEEAVQIAEALYAELQTPESCKDAGEYHLKMGDLLLDLDEAEAAEQQYRQAEELLNRFREQTGRLTADIKLMEVFRSYAELYIKENRLDAAWAELDREEALEKQVKARNSRTETRFLRHGNLMRRSEVLDKQGRVEESMEMRLEAYRVAESMADMKGTLQKTARFLRFGTAANVYEYAKEHNMRGLAREYHKKMVKAEPMFGYQESMKSTVKQLWRKSVITDEKTGNPLTLMFEASGNAMNWAFSGEPFMENRVRPAIDCIRDDIYLYRIPLYPVLSVIMFMMVHATTGRLGVMGVLIPCGLCMEGQILYQIVTSLAMAFAFWGVQKAKKLKWKKTADFGIAVALTILFWLVFVALMGMDALIPASNHIMYLTIPATISLCMALITMMCKHIFRGIVK
ncbi:MAG: TIR domain-containing protein [Candidatus Spyradocola sp.]